MGDDVAASAAKVHEHLDAEAELDLARTLASMQPPYYYEVWPAGLRMEGYDNARAYYDFHFRTLRPRMRASTAVGEWDNLDGVVIERDVQVGEDDGTTTHFRVLAVLTVGDEGVTGERIYASPEFCRLVFGDLLETAFQPVVVRESV
jgi:hypothetical protein